LALNEEIELNANCYGYFESVDFKNLFSLPHDQLVNLFSLLSQIITSGYEIFWHSRLIKKLEIDLPVLPCNAGEMLALSDQLKKKIRLSNGQNIPGSVPLYQRKNIICPSKFICTLNACFH